MKKVLLMATLVLSGILAANAEYLYWSVSSSGTYDSNANVSTLYASYGGNYYALSTAEGFTGSYDMSGWSGDFNLNDAQTSYYVELANYDGSNYSATSNYGPKSYVEISSVTLTSLSKIDAAWLGAQYRAGAVPEPTSGLLMLMGFAMLGLKRKKEV